MASYAKQSKDESLYKMAMRIQARATRRCGELLTTFQSPGARTDQPTAGGDGRLTQRLAASDAGLSERQELTAVRLAKIPEDKFNEAIEGDAPPTVTALAVQGTQAKPIRSVEQNGPSLTRSFCCLVLAARFQKSSYIRPYIVQIRKKPAIFSAAGFLYSIWGG